MKTFATIFLMLLSVHTIGQQNPVQEKYRRLPFGTIKPTGWLKAQMEGNLAGFVGHLDQLVPDLMEDPIYGTGRLHKNSRARDLGNLKEGDAEGDEQYKWWNSETQSNWRDGYVRHALLLQDPKAVEQVRQYVSRILATQDADGYLGIYDKELRYRFTGENGELWSKATLYRGLLAWYEFTGDTAVWNALVKAVGNVMAGYPADRSQPFFAGRDFAGGVAHGLTFTDVLDRMCQLTGNPVYRDYAAFLYRNYSANFTSETDAQLSSILDPAYRLKAHGVHTYEHLRPLLVAAYATGDPQLKKATEIYPGRIRSCTTPAGGAIGDEWIGGRQADATRTGYEYCSLQELLDSYTVLLQKSGDPGAAEEVETIFFNAAQGSRDPDHSCIAYLKTDNSYEMLGTKNGEAEPGRKQTRYKYSPVHQDVAVCCAPNAGRIAPTFLQSCWMAEGDRTIVAPVLGPTVLKTVAAGTPVTIEEVTDYPYSNKLVFRINPEKPVAFRLKIRKPAWALSVVASEKHAEEGGFLVFDRSFSPKDRIEIEFTTAVRTVGDLNGETYFFHGALVYARPIPATAREGKIYAPGFVDYYYAPDDTTRYALLPGAPAQFTDGKITVPLLNKTTGKAEKSVLVPLGKTVLRQAAFR